MKQATAHTKSTVQLDIIVVGAGLSGLATAVAAALSGHRVTVFESAKELLEWQRGIEIVSQVGAGLQVTPNSTRILQKWGLSDRLWNSASRPTDLIVHRYSGEILAKEENFNRNIRAKYQAPFLGLHRVDLQLSLYERAKELGINFKLGEKVDSIDFDIPELTTQSGVKARADLIVAADGLWSRSRACFLKKDDPPLATGDLAYRVVLHIDKITDPELREWILNPQVHFWIGPGAHCVGYSMRAEKMYNLVLLAPDDLPNGVSRQAGTVEDLKARFKEWDPILRKLIDAVDTVEKWKLMHREEMSSWVNEKSNFVFVGDACHPMLPYLAQGANSAVEDGAVLGLLLGHLTSKTQLPAALRLYERLRKARGESIVRETFKQRHDFHLDDGPEQEARDQVFISQLGKKLKGPFPSRWTCPEVQPWLYGYDVYKEVEEAMKNDPFSRPNL
ncbi:FAD-dependent monooxygenase OpS4 [Colletotrichum spaethianum]|uniref:FAD-dependent monooxygenase OpS4 n=1 Tax=Colletotrichum spaethianum TaxID=700344 RepID=A0AA37L7H2_9PEZI|nr:FAD-dependent monooxygenase OpS4 [Colletotrichum spaethianum]GKT41565.1 FAD-dependent monooxygenase OpS4 [Colletotrichum spaethianum]